MNKVLKYNLVNIVNFSSENYLANINMDFGLLKCTSYIDHIPLTIQSVLIRTGTLNTSKDERLGMIKFKKCYFSLVINTCIYLFA